MTASPASVSRATVGTQSPVDLFGQAIERGWNQGDLAAIDELFSPDFVEHQRGIGPGREGVKRSIESLRKAFPDLHLTVEATIADVDRAWAHIVGTGTHGGPFMGVAATGRPIRVDVIDIVRVVDGRIVEHWGVADRLSVAQQIGLVPDRPR